MGPSVEKKTILGFCPFSPATFVAIIMKTHEFVVFPGSGPIGQGPTLVGGRSPRGSGGIMPPKLKGFLHFSMAIARKKINFLIELLKSFFLTL